MDLCKPFEEYIRCEAEIYIFTKLVRKKKVKCFLWLPINHSEAPHFYLLIEDRNDSLFYKEDSDDWPYRISIKIADSSNRRTICDSHVVKDALFSEIKTENISENWNECLIKYHYPKYAFSCLSQRSSSGDAKYRFFISNSDLLKTKLCAIEEYTGEVNRRIISSIKIEGELGHLGVKFISTDRYIGKYDSNIIEVVTDTPLRSLLSLNKRVISVVDFVLLLTSFAERRRLSWYKCDGEINDYYVEFYNTRNRFFHDEETVPLISQYAFEDFLKNVLSNAKLLRLNYMKTIMRMYLSGIDYSMNAKIILWNSILEKILKTKFGNKNDKVKEELINKMFVYTVDLPVMKDMINMRNLLAHGDDVDPKQLLLFHQSWQTLIERVILRELNWGDLSKTDVSPNRSTLFGLI
ncbi:MAG: hypothetical protein HGB23_06015 [Chlorobiaceae bacterium]|nr:hypothetical protein [Chlorobiaceae bacterium]